MLPVVLAAAIWVPLWHDAHVLLYCDNQAVVEILNAGYSKDARIMHLIRCLFIVRSHFCISLRALHIPGATNSLADAISGNNLSYLFSQVPAAVSSQVGIPSPLLAVLVEQQPDWTSVAWSHLFKSCFQLA